MVERVRLRALWSVSGAERAAGSALIGNCHPRAKMGRLAVLGVFLRDSTIDALAGSRPRASLLSRLWCLGGLMWNHARKSADIRAHFVAKNSPHGRKNGAPGFATPLAPSKSGAYSELFKIRKCLKLLST